MKKFISALLIAVCLVLTGCSNAKTVKIIEADSKTDILITVPKSTENKKMNVTWYISFYKLLSDNNCYDDLGYDEIEEYEVGKDAILKGSNVEQLEGASIDIEKSKIKDVINEDFYKNLALRYCEKNKKDNEDIDKLSKKIKKLASDYVERGEYINITVNADEISYDRDVEITHISIPDIDFEMDIDNFRIEVIDVPEKVTVSDEIIEYNTFGGVYADWFIGCELYFNIDGVATEDIENITVESANSYSEILNDENYEKYLEKNSFEYTEHNNTAYKKGDAINLEYIYFVDEDIAQKNDTIMASNIVKMKLSDGREVWDFVYTPSIVLGEYLLLDFIEDELK